MFATFCFQHISLHIQAPKKDPDYEDEDSDVGLFASFTTILETPKSRVLNRAVESDFKKSNKSRMPKSF